MIPKAPLRQTLSGPFENPNLKHSSYNLVQSAENKSCKVPCTGPKAKVCAELNDSCSVAFCNLKPKSAGNFLPQ